jgi:hypothetical protein
MELASGVQERRVEEGWEKQSLVDEVIAEVGVVEKWVGGGWRW